MKGEKRIKTFQNADEHEKLSTHAGNSYAKKWKTIGSKTKIQSNPNQNNSNKEITNKTHITTMAFKKNHEKKKKPAQRESSDTAGLES